MRLAEVVRNRAPVKYAVPSREEVEAWWSCFRMRGEGWEGARARLLDYYRAIPRAIAAREATRLPPAVELDDLVSAGTIGLMQSLEGFDPAANTTFETYCSQRVLGAMLDYLRSLDWHPRLTQRRHRKLERHRDRFRVRHGREAGRDELREALLNDGVSGPEAEFILGDSTILATGSLSAPMGDDDSSTMEQRLSDLRQADPARSALRADLKSFLGRNLTRADRLILYLYYYEDMTMREIGAVLGKSESRVSQMHQQLLDRLKSEWAPRGRAELEG